MNEKNTNIVIPQDPEGAATRRDAMRTLLAGLMGYMFAENIWLES